MLYSSVIRERFRAPASGLGASTGAAFEDVNPLWGTGSASSAARRGPLVEAVTRRQLRHRDAAADCSSSAWSGPDRGRAGVGLPELLESSRPTSGHAD